MCKREGETTELKALVKLKRGIGNIELIEVPEKKLDANEVKIKVASAGICGTDIHTFYNKVPYDPPVIMGHEFSGIVIASGSRAKEFKEGDRVTAEASANTCGKCIYCLEGNNNLCPERKSVGRFVDGAFAEYIYLDKKLVHKIPDLLDLSLAALSEPLSVAIRAVKKCVLTDKKIVIINGPGLIGILIAALASLEAKEVIVLGLSVDKERLEIAKFLGARTVVNIEKQDYKRIISNLSYGNGADFLFECSGVSSEHYNYFNLIRKGGLIVQLGLFEEDIKLDFNEIVYNEFNITGSFSQNWQDFEDAINFLSKWKVSAEDLLIHKLPLGQWKKGFEYSMEKKFLRVMLVP